MNAITLELREMKFIEFYNVMNFANCFWSVRVLVNYSIGELSLTGGESLWLCFGVCSQLIHALMRQLFTVSTIATALSFCQYCHCIFVYLVGWLVGGCGYSWPNHIATINVPMWNGYCIINNTDWGGYY